MDGERLDALARSVGAAPRRGVLRLIAGVALAGPLALLRVREAAACRRAGAPCQVNAQCCVGGRCLRSGSCACKAGTTKIVRRCVAPCSTDCEARGCGCTATYDWRGQEDGATFCGRPSGGCANLTKPCFGHNDCAADELCAATTCPAIQGTTNRCVVLCGA